MKKLVHLFLVVFVVKYLLTPGFCLAQMLVKSNVIDLRLSFANSTYWTQMSFSNDNQTWSEPEIINLLQENWDLSAYGGCPEDGIKCVYARVRKDAGPWSESISGCLVLLTDSDGDGLPDAWEINYGLDPNDPGTDNGAAGDPDADGLTNLEEYNNQTHPKLADTDGDGMNDAWEVAYGLDPLRDNGAEDADADGYSNYEEYTKGWNPQRVPVTIYVDDNPRGSEDGSLEFPFNTAQEALEVAVGGDTVQVYPGVYQGGANIIVPEGVFFNGAGAQYCQLNLERLYALQLESFSVVRGFNITNPARGKNIIYADSILSAVISNNIIKGTSDSLGAIFLNNASARIENNTIIDSYIGIWTVGSSAIIKNNLVVKNGMGLLATNTNNLELAYNNVWASTFFAYYNLPGGNTDFSLDPQFVNPDNDNYYLTLNSPARDAGDPDQIYSDLDDSRNDLGAYGGGYQASLGRVVSWTFNEDNGSTVYDKSNYNNNGTIYGATRTDDSLLNKALSFDGIGNYVTTGTIGVPSGAFNAMTTTMWVKFRNTTDNNKYIFHYGDCQPNKQWSVIQENNKVFWSNAGTGDLSSISSFTLEDGWVHLALVYDGVKKYIYWNGQLDNSTSYSSFNVTDATIHLAAYEGSINYFSGLIDEVTIYNCALSDQEVLGCYQRVSDAGP